MDMDGQISDFVNAYEAEIQVTCEIDLVITWAPVHLCVEILPQDKTDPFKSALMDKQSTIYTTLKRGTQVSEAVDCIQQELTSKRLAEMNQDTELLKEHKVAAVQSCTFASLSLTSGKSMFHSDKVEEFVNPQRAGAVLRCQCEVDLVVQMESACCIIM